MFTRYNGVKPPQNYSGNRFRRNVYETETKVHSDTRPKITVDTEVRVPATSFQVEIDKISSESDIIDTPPEIIVESGKIEGESESADENSVAVGAQIKADSSHRTDSPSEGALSKLLSSLKLPSVSSLKGLMGGSDELLLICVLLLVYSSPENDNFDTVLILILLLLSGGSS